jgi:8-oxo-dGTP diphosphatase
MSIDPKITIGNVCFVINEHTSKVLLLKRSRHPMKDQYTGVGGKTYYEEDIRFSCIREVKEETGLDLTDIQLKGVLKTVLAEGGSSSWILFVYVGKTADTALEECDEGILEWVNESELATYDLIGFIKEILPNVLDKNQFFEGTIHHDRQGRVIHKTLAVSKKETVSYAQT